MLLTGNGNHSGGKDLESSGLKPRRGPTIYFWKLSFKLVLESLFGFCKRLQECNDSCNTKRKHRAQIFKSNGSRELFFLLHFNFTKFAQNLALQKSYSSNLTFLANFQQKFALRNGLWDFTKTSAVSTIGDITVILHNVVLINLPDVITCLDLEMENSGETELGHVPNSGETDMAHTEHQ